MGITITKKTGESVRLKNAPPDPNAEAKAAAKEDTIAAAEKFDLEAGAFVGFGLTLSRSSKTEEATGAKRWEARTYWGGKAATHASGKTAFGALALAIKRAIEAGVLKLDVPQPPVEDALPPKHVKRAEGEVP